jgi:type I restriction enzyme S subunit
MSDDGEQASLDEIVGEYEKGEGDGGNENGWKTEELGELADYQNGNAFSKDEWSDEGYPIIRIQNLTGEQEDYNYFDGELDDQYRVEEGDILLSWSATIDLFEWRGGTAALNQHIYRVDTSEVVNSQFFKFKLEEVLPRLEALSHGSTMKHVRKADLVNLDVELPPLPEQRKIASVLYNVDEAIRKTEEIIEGTKRVKKGVKQHVFHTGIGENETEHMEFIGDIPAHWEVVMLREVCENITDGTHVPYDAQEEGYPCLTGKNIRDNRFRLDDIKKVSEEAFEEMTSRVDPQKGDVLFVKDGSIGYTQVNDLDFDFGLLESVMLIRTDDTKLRPHFLQQMLTWDTLREVIISRRVGTGIERMTISGMEKSEILLPSIEEQKQIEKILLDIDENLTIERKTKDRLHRLKRALMQDLLTGEVRTADRDIDVLPEVEAHG